MSNVQLPLPRTGVRIMSGMYWKGQAEKTRCYALVDGLSDELQPAYFYEEVDAVMTHQEAATAVCTLVQEAMEWVARHEL